MNLLLAAFLAIVTGTIFDHPQQVIGIEARTSNAKEMTKDAVIPKQWERFMKEGLLARIPNKTGQSIVALYADYESDKDGAYTYVLGARVTSISTIPEGMVAREIPAGRYAIFTSDRGPVARVVYETWKRIWAAPLDRAYRTDFELYGQRAADPQSAQVKVYVGIR
jgi:predicted transcriptional regulator YdeE